MLYMSWILSYDSNSSNILHCTVHCRLIEFRKVSLKNLIWYIVIWSPITYAAYFQEIINIGNQWAPKSHLAPNTSARSTGPQNSPLKTSPSRTIIPILRIHTFPNRSDQLNKSPVTSIPPARQASRRTARSQDSSPKCRSSQGCSFARWRNLWDRSEESSWDSPKTEPNRKRSARRAPRQLSKTVATTHKPFRPRTIRALSRLRRLSERTSCTTGTTSSRCSLGCPRRSSWTWKNSSELIFFRKFMSSCVATGEKGWDTGLGNH